MSAQRDPGWYPDASKPGYERWWDGGTWSHVTREAPTPAAPPPGASPQQYPQPYGQQYGQYPPAPPQYPTGGYPAAGHPGGGYPDGVYPVYPSAKATPDGVPLAGQGWRLLARILDGIVTGLVTFALGWQSLMDMFDAFRRWIDSLPKEGPPPSSAELQRQLMSDPAISSGLLRFTLIAAVVSAVYHVVLIALRGATLGKMAVGVRVRPYDREGRPGWGASLLRWAGTELPGLVPTAGGLYSLLDSLWCLWDPKRQCLHDKLPKTVVVRRR